MPTRQFAVAGTFKSIFKTVTSKSVSPLRAGAAEVGSTAPGVVRERGDRCVPRTEDPVAPPAPDGNPASSSSPIAVEPASGGLLTYCALSRWTGRRRSHWPAPPGQGQIARLLPTHRFSLDPPQCRSSPSRQGGRRPPCTGEVDYLPSQQGCPNARPSQRAGSWERSAGRACVSFTLMARRLRLSGRLSTSAMETETPPVSERPTCTTKLTQDQRSRGAQDTDNQVAPPKAMGAPSAADHKSKQHDHNHRARYKGKPRQGRGGVG